jgi:hypothetical protein
VPQAVGAGWFGWRGRGGGVGEPGGISGTIDVTVIARRRPFLAANRVRPTAARGDGGRPGVDQVARAVPRRAPTVCATRAG